ncbi:MAG: glycosyltransferase family 39 protein [Actinomycetota bacterium]|nr:glycosyltransferase family 39 protein [Actinomycetota bacterium]
MSGSAEEERPPLTAWVFASALLAVALLMAVGATGYHRDELYFLEASRHPAWGYVDQPPLSVALVGLSRILFGTSLVGLRLFPALADGVMVLLTGMVAREFGGDRFAQILASLAVAVSPILIAGHVAGPTIYDLLAWVLVSFLVLRILRGGDARAWLLIGLAVGVALVNKETILLLVGGLALGFVLNRHWWIFKSPWLWIGAALAVAIWSPVLVWESQNGWPTLAMSRNLQREHSGFEFVLTFVPIQLLLPGWWVAPVWIAGFWALLRAPAYRRFRAFAIAYATGFVLLLVLIPDRPYYVAGLYPALLAAGAPIAGEVIAGTRRFLSTRPPRLRLVWRSRVRAFGFVLVVGLLFLPLSLPVLPPSVLADVPLQALNYNLGEVVGWPRFVRIVAGVVRSLPPSEQAGVVILTDNYGEAGAIDRFGPELGLPPASSGHNSYWLWGPPRASASTRGTTVTVGFSRPYLLGRFSRVTLAARIDNGLGVENDEQGQPVWICRELRAPWPVLWPGLKQFG